MIRPITRDGPGKPRCCEGDDPAEEIANGKIKYVLHGKKLRGEFTVAAGAEHDDLLAAARAVPNVANRLDGAEVVKTGP